MCNFNEKKAFLGMPQIVEPLSESDQQLLEARINRIFCSIHAVGLQIQQVNHTLRILDDIIQQTRDALASKPEEEQGAEETEEAEEALELEGAEEAEEN